MGSLEVQTSLAGLANFAVSSELQIPAYGLPYDAILSRISINPFQTTKDIARAFTDEYVKFGALIADITSQAAVTDLSQMTNTTTAFREFSQLSSDFMPILKTLFESIRNSSSEVEAGDSVDIGKYAATISTNSDTPKRLSRITENLRENISKAIVVNRLFISSTDSLNISQGDLTGLSIFFPQTHASLSNYESSSDTAMIWGRFLEEYHANDTFVEPAADMTYRLIDMRYNDDLPDSVQFDWISTPEIKDWCIDFMIEGRLAPQSSLKVNDSELKAIMDSLNPGIYDICVYGRNSSGDYRYYEFVSHIEIMRRYVFNIFLPREIDLTGTQLYMNNLRTNQVTALGEIDVYMTTIAFEVPKPFLQGDKILIELKKDNETLARGLVVLEGENMDIQLMQMPAPPAIITFAIFVMASALLIFASIRLLRIGEAGGIKLGMPRRKTSSSRNVSLSKTRPLRKAEPPSETASSARDEEPRDRRR